MSPSGAQGAAPTLVHATLVAARRQGRWCGALLQGSSGAGKSDLALRAMAGGWRLVADDRVRLWTSGGRLYGSAPTTLLGLIEARGLGVLPEPALPFARLSLAVEAATHAAPVERMPEVAAITLLGVSLRQVRLAMCEPSVLPKLERALDAVLRAGKAGSSL